MHVFVAEVSHRCPFAFRQYQVLRGLSGFPGCHCSPLPSLGFSLHSPLMHSVFQIPPRTFIQKGRSTRLPAFRSLLWFCWVSAPPCSVLVVLAPRAGRADVSDLGKELHSEEEYIFLKCFLHETTSLSRKPVRIPVLNCCLFTTRGPLPEVCFPKTGAARTVGSRGR